MLKYGSSGKAEGLEAEDPDSNPHGHRQVGKQASGGWVEALLLLGCG